MDEEQKIEILYDHYKDTFENQKISLQKRNLYTIICLCLIGTFAFQLNNPEQTSNISNELIKNNIGDIKVDFNYINNVLTFSLLWVVILYYQVNFLIEKIYTYLQEIEEKISKKLKPFEISREGKTYLDHYPWLSEVVHRIYTIIFPVGIIIVSIIKWFIEKQSFEEPLKSGHFWFDTIFLFAIVLTSLLYLSNIHFNDFKKKK